MADFLWAGVTALARIFNLFQADCSSKLGENHSTLGKTPDLPWTQLGFVHVVE